MFPDQIYSQKSLCNMSLLIPTVPDATFVYIRGWIQMVFYYHIIYCPETNNQHKTLFTITIIKAERWTVVHNVTYSVHDEVLMSYWSRLVVLLASPWTSCHLRCCRLILLPTWRARSPLRPLTHGSHFPQGSCTTLFPLSVTRRCFKHGIMILCSLLSGTEIHNST